MKLFSSFRGLFVLAFVLLVTINIVVLAGVASNRSGDPTTLTNITEREIELPYRIHMENSGLTLRLIWRTLDKNENNTRYSSKWGSPAWFSAEKLHELGFNLDGYHNQDGKETLYKSPIEKEVFIVIENNGDLHKEALKRAEKALEKEKASLKLNPGDKNLIKKVERAEEWLKRERVEESRLFAIDAGLDFKKLREAYEDRGRFIIVKGQVKPRRNYYKYKEDEVLGVITKLNVEGIHVPLKHRKMFDSIMAKDKTKQNEFQAPRYGIELAYGSRFEPWIVSIQPLQVKR
jgi:hypothetical protein